jgi:hypothetical protein
MSNKFTSREYKERVEDKPAHNSASNDSNFKVLDFDGFGFLNIKEDT